MHADEEEWPFLQTTDLRDLDLGSGHTAYSHVSLVDFCLRTKFCSNL